MGRNRGFSDNYHVEFNSRTSSGGLLTMHATYLTSSTPSVSTQSLKIAKIQTSLDHFGQISCKLHQCSLGMTVCMAHPG